MSNDSPASVVGNKFVLEYYSTLSKNPELISQYYTADSVMSRGQASFEDEKQNSIQSSSALEGIQNAINTTNFKNCNFNLSGINCQKSFNRGVLLVVHGNVHLKDQKHPRQFMQTFFLAPQTEPLYSYYVFNDIFNFIVTAPAPAATATIVTAAPKAVEEVHTPVQQQAANPVPVPTTTTANNNNNNLATTNGTHTTNASPIPAPSTVQVAVVHPTTTPAASTNNTPTTTTNNVATTPAATTTTTPAPTTTTTTTTTTAAVTTAVATSPIPPATTTTTTTPAAPTTNTNNKGSTKQNKNYSSNGTAKASNTKQQQEQPQQVAEPVKQRSPSWANVVNVGNSNGVQPNQIPLPSIPPLIKNKAGRSNSASGGSNNSSSSPNNGRGGFKRGDKEKLIGAKHERSIYVGNLPFACKEDEVYENFKGFGQIYEIVLKDMGYCFVQYYAPDSASKALGSKEKIVIGGRELTIEPRKAESDRPKKNKQKAQQ